MGFEKKVIKSFMNVKEEISNINSKIELIENKILVLETHLNDHLQMHLHLHQSPKSAGAKYEGYKAYNPEIQKSSIRNEGVPSADLQHFSSPSAPPAPETNSNIKEDKIWANIGAEVKELKQDLLNKFVSLTHLEFKTFLSIYRLEEEQNRPISYHEIAEYMRLSSGGVRATISDLIEKKIPLTKQKMHKNKVYLSIKKEFRDLKLIGNLVSLRENIGPKEGINRDLTKFI